MAGRFAAGGARRVRTRRGLGHGPGRAAGPCPSWYTRRLLPPDHAPAPRQGCPARPPPRQRGWRPRTAAPGEAPQPLPVEGWVAPPGRIAGTNESRGCRAGVAPRGGSRVRAPAGRALLPPAPPPSHPYSPPSPPSLPHPPRRRSGPFKRGGDVRGGHSWRWRAARRHSWRGQLPVRHGSARRAAGADAGPGGRRGRPRLPPLHRREDLLPRHRHRHRHRLGRMVGAGAAGAAGPSAPRRRGKRRDRPSPGFPATGPGSPRDPRYQEPITGISGRGWGRGSGFLRVLQIPETVQLGTGQGVGVAPVISRLGKPVDRQRDPSEHVGLGKREWGQDPRGISHQDPPGAGHTGFPRIFRRMTALGDLPAARPDGKGAPGLNHPWSPPGWRWGHGGWRDCQDPLLQAGPSNSCLNVGLGVPGPAPHPPVSPQLDWRQVLVLGLDGAGKSSVLHYICSQKARDRIAPTHGFNSAQLFVEGMEMDLLEGKAGMALRWPQGGPKG